MHNLKRLTLCSDLNYLSHVLFISMLLHTTISLADGTADCNVGSTTYSIECGIGASALGEYSTSIGSLSTAAGDYSTAFGANSQAYGDFSTATGIYSWAHSTGSVSMGYNAGYNGSSEVINSPEAIGNRSNIRPMSPGAIAIGGDVDNDYKGAEAAGAIALGADVYNDVPNSMLINVPLRIENPIVPIDALYLSANKIGIGISTPVKTVHIVKNDGTASMRIEENSTTIQKRYQIQLENNGPTGFKFTDKNNDSIWQFSQTPAGGFGFANTANGGQDFVMNSDGRVLMGPGPVTNFNLAPDGDLEIPNGAVTATTFHSSSSRATKKDFTKVDTDKLMSNIKAMEVTEWRYKDENSKGRHIGPMAEDFYAMFGLGPDDKHVAATDMASIALIAAKELQKRTEAMDVETANLKANLQTKTSKLKAVFNTETMALKAENASLKERLASLEKLVTNLASGQGLLPEKGNKVVFNK